jgi:hypothetical protein
MIPRPHNPILQYTILPYARWEVSLLVCEMKGLSLTRRSRVIGKEGDGAFPSASRQLQRKGLAILRIALVIALILGVIAATDISSNESASTQASIKHYR